MNDNAAFFTTALFNTVLFAFLLLLFGSFF